MKILFICKRNYTSKDLLCEKYGRLYEFSKAFHESGHVVTCVCANYYGINNSYLNDGVVYWHNYDFNHSIITGPIGYYNFLKKAVEREEPDVIIGLSDIFHVLLSLLLSKKYKLPFIIDLYDNFESFGIARIPGVKILFHYAMNEADGISVVSPELKNHLMEKHKLSAMIEVVENAVDIKAFHPINKVSMRKKLNLPENGIYIGVAGALSEKRGISNLFTAYMELLDKYENLYLVMAGPMDKSLKLPSCPNIRYFGELAYDEIPSFLNTFDVGVILNLDDAFGKFCFPQKFYEMMSCRIPVVASRVGVMSRMLSETPEVLFDPDDPESLKRALELQLTEKLIIETEVLQWDRQANKLINLINKVMQKYNA